MLRITFILILISSASIGQTSIDYQLYSKAIDSFINQGIKYQVSTTEVVIIKKYSPKENEISNFLTLLQDKEFRNLYTAFQYDTLKIELSKEQDFKNSIVQLEKVFFETPTLDENKLTLLPAKKAMTTQEFQNLFANKQSKKIDNGWKKFYKMYPGSHGIFEFSKIIYNGSYACFYSGRHSNGLSGSGDIIVLQKENDVWKIVTYFNLWVS